MQCGVHQITPWPFLLLHWTPAAILLANWQVHNEQGHVPPCLPSTVSLDENWYSDSMLGYSITYNIVLFFLLRFTSCPYNLRAPSALLPKLFCYTCCQVMSPAASHLNMSSYSTAEAFKFPKLKGSNYSTWSDHMQSALHAKYLWSLIKGTKPCLTEPITMKPAAQTLSRIQSRQKGILRLAASWRSCTGGDKRSMWGFAASSYKELYNIQRAVGSSEEGPCHKSSMYKHTLLLWGLTHSKIYQWNTYGRPHCSNCKGNLTDLRRGLHLSLAKGNPK
jgi:hypothetical protein